MKSIRLFKSFQRPYHTIISIVVIWSLFFTRPYCYGPAFADTFAVHHSGSGKLRPLAMVERQERNSALFAQIAKAHGHFYTGVIDTILGDLPIADKRQRISQLIDNLPPHLKGLYQKGIEAFYEEQRMNADLIKQHQGDEVRYLLSCVARGDGRDEAEVQEILSDAQHMATYLEPYDGIPVIEIENEYYGKLIGYGIVPSASDGVAFSSEEENEPDFIVIRRRPSLRGREGLKGTVGHEMHHFIRSFLKRAGLIGRIKEATPELEKAFEQLRNEFCAYIIEGTSLLARRVDAEGLVYTDDKEIQEMALDTKYSAGLCVAIAEKKGIPASDFLYAVERSGTFAEVTQNFYALTPFEQLKTRDVLDVIRTSYDNEKLVAQAKRMLSHANIVISKEELGTWVLEFLRERKINNRLVDMQRELAKLSSFLQATFDQAIDSERILFTLCKERTPLSDASIQFLITLSSKSPIFIPMRATSPADFARKFTEGYSHIGENAALRRAYEDVLGHCPDLAEMVKPGIPAPRPESDNVPQQAHKKLQQAI